MIFVIDVGNTNMTMGVFCGEKLAATTASDAIFRYFFVFIFIVLLFYFSIVLSVCYLAVFYSSLIASIGLMAIAR